MSCVLVVVRVFLRQVSQHFTSLKVVKRPASLFKDFLKKSAHEQLTLKFSSNQVLTKGLVVISHVELINAISSGLFTKDLQSFLFIELNLKVSMCVGESSFAIKWD